MGFDAGMIPTDGIRKITYFDVTGSTSTDLKEMIKSGAAKAGDIVAASRQTAGRGRHGKDFASPAGGIYFSFAAQNKEGSLPTVAAGVAVAKTLEGYGYSPSIKWVNDVLINGKKVCGILAEALAGTSFCVIGIGINLKSSAIPQTLSDSATALDTEKGDLPRAEELVGRIVSEYEKLCSANGADIIGEYEKYLSFLGKEITLTGSGEVCTAHGVNHAGELEVEFSDGRRGFLNSGEISIKIN